MALCSAGFADGALARWRTLHELAVILKFITNSNDIIAARFLLKEQINTLQVELSFLENSQKPTQNSLKRRNEIANIIEQIKVEFGRGIESDYGWATTVPQERINFRTIENKVDYSSSRPYVKHSSLLNHASHMWPEQLLGTPHFDPSGPIIGPSPYGIEIPLTESIKTMGLIALDIIPRTMKFDHIVIINLIGIYVENSYKEIRRSARKQNDYTNLVNRGIQ